VSQTEKLLSSGTEGDMYSTVEAATATCGAMSEDRLKQLPTDITLLSLFLR